MIFSCTLTFTEMGRFDSIEWEIVQSTDDTSNLGAVNFLIGVTSTSLPLTFMGTTFQASTTFHSTMISSTLTVVIPAQLNGLIIVCLGGGIQNSTSTITITSEYVSCYCSLSGCFRCVVCAGSPPVSPRTAQLSNFQNNSNTAMATLQWDTPDGSAVDNYSVTISPPADPLPVIITFPMPSLTLTLKYNCLLYTSPSPRDATLSRMPSSA